jgi:TnpA family transposase
MARRDLLTQEDRERLFLPRTDHFSIIKNYTLSTEDLDVIGRRRGPVNQLGVAAHLALLRHPGFGLRTNSDIPEAVLSYLAAQICVPPEVFVSYGQRQQTRTDHSLTAAEYLELRPFTRADVTHAIEVAARAAMLSDRGETIARSLMERLKADRFILPLPDTLERSGLAGRARARKRAAAEIVAELDDTTLELLDALLINEPNLGMTPLAWLRDMPGSPSTKNMNALLKRLKYIRQLGIDPGISLATTGFRFGQFVREGAVAPPFLLADYSHNRRRATLAAAMVNLEVKLADAAILMFERLIGGLFTRARRGQERRYQDTAPSVGKLMRLFGATIAALDIAEETGGDPLVLVDEMVGWHRLMAARPHVDALADLAQEDTLVLATERYATLRRFSGSFLDTFAFKASGSGTSLLSAIDLLKKTNASRGAHLPEHPPMPFANRQWSKLIMEGGKVSRARYETAVLATLRDKLRAGDVWVEGTRAYQRFDAYLLPRKAAQSAIADLPINVNAGQYLAEKSAELDRRLRHFAHQLRTGHLPGVALVRDKLKVVPLQAATPPEAEVLDRRLDALLPRVRITELLFEVAERTGFLAAFRDVRSGKEHDKPHAVLAAILADGTNLGVERMANASQGVTYAQLAWTQNWYISPENYEAALAQIVREHHRLPFARNWGEGVSASSDGQFFRTGRIRSGAAEINAKYGHEPGIKIYSHLSDHFASFSSRIMSATASEAPYVLDGLMLGARELPLQELYTDTGGASDHVFGLCHLLGFRFVPRMRDLADRRLGAIAASSTYKGIECLFGQAIKVGAIEAEWDDLIRMAASIRGGTVAPSVILRKLSAYRRQNKLDLALRELGRIERTLFTLDWLEQPELRRACQAGLNKGEARHALADAIYTNRQGRFTDRTLENQQYRASGLNLLIAAIAYWNTLYLGRAADHLRYSGVEMNEALLAHVSPLGWSHIGLTGDYLWEDASSHGGSGYRALHDPSGRFRLVA